MRLRRLRLENLRAFESVDLDLDPGWNVFVGANGAGKTTLLEAAYLLSHARSFRAGSRDALIRRSADGFAVHGRVEHDDGAVVGLGLARAVALEARIDGATVAVSELLRRVAVACFEPGSHALISGPAEERRRFMDWGVFHVEHRFLPTWRTFRRALQQRNALLRNGTSAAELDPWDRQLALTGNELTAMRAQYMAGLTPIWVSTLQGLLAELGEARITFEDGWRGEGDPLELLAASREADRQRGHTTQGPHRADWSIAFENAPRREHLSRGQEKLCALACILAQAQGLAASRGEWPVLCVDDLASELDAPHQETLIAALRAAAAQVLVTGTHEPKALSGVAATRFHVEPGRVSRLL